MVLLWKYWFGGLYFVTEYDLNGLNFLPQLYVEFNFTIYHIDPDLLLLFTANAFIPLSPMLTGHIIQRIDDLVVF